jgi:hypothetical protein
VLVSSAFSRRPSSERDILVRQGPCCSKVWLLGWRGVEGKGEQTFVLTAAGLMPCISRHSLLQDVVEVSNTKV